jgi:hypothetical protein
MTTNDFVGMDQAPPSGQVMLSSVGVRALEAGLPVALTVAGLLATQAASESVLSAPAETFGAPPGWAVPVSDRPCTGSRTGASPSLAQSAG